MKSGATRRTVVDAKPHWHQEALGNVIELISGQHIDAKDYNSIGRGLPYLTGPSDFGETNPRISRWTEHPKKSAIRGDILLTVKGSGVGKTNVLDIDEAVISRQIMAVRAKNIDPNYLALIMQANQKYFLGLASGAAIPGISRGDVTSLNVTLPPREEQKRIVAVLNQAFAALDHARAHAEANLADASALFGSTLADAFYSKGEVPTEALGSICRFEGGSQPPKSKFVDSPRKGYIRLLQIRDFKSDEKAVYIPDDGKRRRCAEDDIMIGRYGASVGQIHRGKAGTYNVALIKTIGPYPLE